MDLDSGKQNTPALQASWSHAQDFIEMMQDAGFMVEHISHDVLKVHKRELGATIALETIPPTTDRVLMVRPFENRPKAFPTTASAREVGEYILNPQSIN
jgi:hypothetical protein